ncbi:NUDIX hydrolase domain-like protein [Ochromonadaceae sp. CCMP2298]|nr:NUDIX hydrolase domain-like protein [Ochromonadaceae sp. CCMP2298]
MYRRALSGAAGLSAWALVDVGGLRRQQAQSRVGAWRPALGVTACAVGPTTPIITIPTTPKTPIPGSQIPQFGNSAPTLVPEGVLPYKDDRYGGVIVDKDALLLLGGGDGDGEGDRPMFRKTLEDSVSYWRSIQRRGVWLRVPLSHAALVPDCVDAGFVFHHAEKDYLMLTHWLSTRENKLPPNASHQVGVGAVVLHPTKRLLLLVQEKNGPLKGTGLWKVPTGLADQGEDIADAAVREVWEETGVRADFEGILNFRQAHGQAFGKSDLYFVCLLTARSTGIVPQESEIAAAEWVSPEVYFDQPLFKKSGVYNRMNEIMRTYVEGVVANRETASSAAATAAITATTPTAAITTTGTTGTTGTAATDASTNTATAAQAPYMVSSKLPVGFRPGLNALYHYPDTNTHDKKEQGTSL